MDEIIYILLAVGWVAYSIYNARQKKKIKEEQERQRSQQAQHETTDEEYSPPRRSVIEEILMGEFEEFEEENETEVIQKIPEYTFSEPKAIPVPEPKAVPLTPVRDYHPIKENPLFKIPVEKESLIEGTSSSKSKFDLREAVIYATILKRPYE